MTRRGRARGSNVDRREGEKEIGTVSTVTILDSQRTRSTSLRTVAEVSARAARGSLVLKEEGTRHEIEQKRERERERERMTEREGENKPREGTREGEHEALRSPNKDDARGGR